MKTITELRSIIWEWTSDRLSDVGLYRPFSYLIYGEFYSPHWFVWRYDLWYGVQNCIKWFPVIWGDRNWDHYHLNTMIEKKLGYMEEQQRKYSNHMNATADANDIAQARKYLKHLMDDDICDNLRDAHDEKWGKGEFRSEPIEGGDYNEIFIDRSNAVTDEEKEQERKEYRHIMFTEAGLRRLYKRRLFKIMENNLERWWS